MKLEHFRSNISDLPDNPAADVFRYARGRQGLITLAQGEGSRPTPDFIIEAASVAMERGETFYGPVLGLCELRETISNYYKDIYDLNIERERIFITGSGTTAMHLALTSILDRGDEVVAVTPIWKNLLGAVELAEAKTVQVSLNHDEAQGWHLDMDALMAGCNEKTKAILMVTPSNPSGWVMSNDEITTMLDFARERNIWIVADEVYGRLVYEGGCAPSFLDHANDDDLLMVVNSFSKAWAMTGWRLGWLVGPRVAESVIRDIALYDNMGPPTFTQYGGMKAITEGEQFIKDQLSLWTRNKDTIMKRLGDHPDIEISAPKASFYAFFKIAKQPNCVEFCKKLIDEAGLALTPGCAFGKECAGWYRLCFAVSTEKLEEALDRLLKAL